ncbi:uncharacterized protein Z519_00661 [Cladophialophora bantiana CBS 173.52]|uniref:Methyltransferase domain-containing protein n=1 Tax=Cladophialophora bantiana (strain ATCC 10958 / CBS 173.52 / CDC B-1940 / NIH 8579) TaxID=1442370 RepID=A0A0D2HZZ3_CLAB1|nr:uncharacterized protein Z519_00661 [Cladophialophora bantiana CBS 173.52]KIW98998.1 hypothetical protein Z519_00661 [Cladophialophora bantiana CBS 173.52]
MSLPADNHDGGADQDPGPVAPIAADDADSALGEEDDILSTSSLTSSVFDYIQEHGRTYNAYGERTYVLPNDEDADVVVLADRIGSSRYVSGPGAPRFIGSLRVWMGSDLQHQLLKMTFGDRLSTCGVEDRRDLHYVLDVGTGTGIWSIEYVDREKVLGVDVSPVQPDYVPPNVRFEVMDAGQPWAFNYSFDFVFSRFMTGAIADWRQFIQQCYENLAPGGMLEVQDISFNLQCDDGTLPKNSALARWAAYMLEASKQLGCPLDSVESVKRIMIETGFVDVVQKPYSWPMNPWVKEEKLKKIGELSSIWTGSDGPENAHGNPNPIGLWTYHNFCGSLSGISLALFTRGLSWSADELEVFLVDVRKDMRNTGYHAFWPIYSISGTKPG